MSKADDGSLIDLAQIPLQSLRDLCKPLVGTRSTAAVIDEKNRGTRSAFVESGHVPQL